MWMGDNHESVKPSTTHQNDIHPHHTTIGIFLTNIWWKFWFWAKVYYYYLCNAEFDGQQYIPCNGCAHAPNDAWRKWVSESRVVHTRAGSPMCHTLYMFKSVGDTCMCSLAHVCFLYNHVLHVCMYTMLGSNALVDWCESGHESELYMVTIICIFSCVTHMKKHVHGHTKDDVPVMWETHFGVPYV